MRTTLKRGIGRGAEVNGNGHGVIPPGTLSPVTLYRQPPQQKPGLAKVIGKFFLGLGVLDIHTDFVESPELVRDRILYAVEVFGDPARIHVCPDCGLRTRSWDVAYEKLRALVEGCRLAEEALTRAQVTS